MDEQVTGAAPAAPSVPEQTEGTPAPAAEQTTPATPAAQTTQTQTEQQGTSSAQDGVIASANTSDGKRFVLEKDPVTGRRIVRKVDVPQVQQPQTEQTTPVVEETGTATVDAVEKAAQQVNAEPEAYTLDEFSAALSAGQIDERRVPDEFKAQYANFKIQQAVNEYNARKEAEKKTQEQVQKQLTPEEQAEAMKEFYKKLDAEAKKKALKDIGMTQEQYEEMDYDDENSESVREQFRIAQEWHRQQIINDIQSRAAAENVARKNQQAIYKDVVNFVNEARNKEPNFAVIDKMMENRYKTLPYAEGRKVEDALVALKNGTITSEQTVALREYYESTRKEYYAQKNNLSTVPKAAPKPPVVETPGDGHVQQQETAIDYSQLRNATNIKDKRAWLSEFFRNKKH